MKMNKSYLGAAGAILLAATSFSAAAQFRLEPVAPEDLPSYVKANLRQQQEPIVEIPEYEGYTLVWHDEFEEDGAPNPKLWTFEKGFVRNKELQWYQPENAYVENGNLVIEARRQEFPNPDYVKGSDKWWQERKNVEYTSASLNTSKSLVFQFGRLEVRAKIPTAKGAFPAIWIKGNQYRSPANGEIDLMEYYIRKGVPTILGNFFWGKSMTEGDSKMGKVPLAVFLDEDPDWVNQFHVWRLDWDEESAQIFVDGFLVNEINLDETDGIYNGMPFNALRSKKAGFGDYIMLNVALGANQGTPDADAFPMKMEVDYVRLYQK